MRVVGLAAVWILAACASPPKLANVTPDPMPAGETWPGVYNDAQLGDVQLVAGREPNSVVGLWMGAGYWGAVNGTIDGDILRFVWSEHPVGPCAALGHARSGHGYFRYAIMADRSTELHGEHGTGADELGTHWTWTKQTGIAPDIESIRRAIRRLSEVTLDPDANCGGFRRWRR
jgi:hypothetical protein